MANQGSTMRLCIFLCDLLQRQIERLPPATKWPGMTHGELGSAKVMPDEALPPHLIYLIASVVFLFGGLPYQYCKARWQSLKDSTCTHMHIQQRCLANGGDQYDEHLLRLDFTSISNADCSFVLYKWIFASYLLAVHGLLDSLAFLPGKLQDILSFILLLF